MGKFSCYAVYNGKNPTDGTTVSKVCATWNECYALTHGVENVKYKGFNSQKEALAWINNQDKEEEDKPELSLPDWAENKPKKNEPISADDARDSYLLHIINGTAGSIGIVSATLYDRKKAEEITKYVNKIEELCK